MEKNSKQTIKTEQTMVSEERERLYIGCKVIKAMPMTFGEFRRIKLDENVENADGYRVEYPDGYISWSPKWVFENAYRLITEGEKELFNL